MSKKIVYVDMDGVVADFDKKMAELNPDLYVGEGDNYEERSKLVNEEIIKCPSFFLDLKPIPNAIESVIKLNDKYEIYFLSTPTWWFPKGFGDKKLWLDEHFGELAFKKLILTHRKDLNIGDYLIDDTTRNGVANFKGKHIHFGSKEFPDWDNVIKYLI